MFRFFQDDNPAPAAAIATVVVYDAAQEAAMRIINRMLDIEQRTSWVILHLEALTGEVPDHLRLVSNFTFAFIESGFTPLVGLCKTPTWITSINATLDVAETLLLKEEANIAFIQRVRGETLHAAPCA